MNMPKSKASNEWFMVPRKCASGMSSEIMDIDENHFSFDESTVNRSPDKDSSSSVSVIDENEYKDEILQRLRESLLEKNVVTAPHLDGFLCKNTPAIFSQFGKEKEETIKAENTKKEIMKRNTTDPRNNRIRILIGEYDIEHLFKTKWMVLGQILVVIFILYLIGSCFDSNIGQCKKSCDQELLSQLRQENKLFRDQMFKDIKKENFKLNIIMRRLQREKSALGVFVKRNAEYVAFHKEVLGLKEQINALKLVEAGNSTEDEKNKSNLTEEKLAYNKLSNKDFTVLINNLEQFNELINIFSNELGLLPKNVTVEQKYEPEDPCSFFNTVKHDKYKKTNISNPIKGFINDFHTKTFSTIISEHVKVLKDVGSKSYEYVTNGISCLVYRFEYDLDEFFKFKQHSRIEHTVKDFSKELHKLKS